MVLGVAGTLLFERPCDAPLVHRAVDDPGFVCVALAAALVGALCPLSGITRQWWLPVGYVSPIATPRVEPEVCPDQFSVVPDEYYLGTTHFARNMDEERWRSQISPAPDRWKLALEQWDIRCWTELNSLWTERFRQSSMKEHARLAGTKPASRRNALCGIRSPACFPETGNDRVSSRLRLVRRPRQERCHYAHRLARSRHERSARRYARQAEASDCR